MHRLSRRTLTVLAALCALPLSLAAQAQTTEPASVEGNTLNLTIPAGYCKLTRDAEPGRTLYGSQDRMQTGVNLVVLIYGDCKEVAQLKSGKARALPHYGMYLAPLSAGHVSKLPLTVSRAQALDEIAKSVPAMNPAVLEQTAGARAKSEGVAMNKMTSGLLGRDANAVYVGLAANVSGAGAAPNRFHAVTALTYVKGVGLSSNLYSPVEPGAPFDKLWAAQKALAAALVKAN
ncbi:MAG TPA: hypothetical protein VGN52_20025 [Burkholderiales bacterium]|jgi:hypothetical protein